MKFFKDIVRLKDTLKVSGGVSSTGRGIRMPDGSPVPVETIMREFGVSQEEAEKISKRNAR